MVVRSRRKNTGIHRTGPTGGLPQGWVSQSSHFVAGAVVHWARRVRLHFLEMKQQASSDCEASFGSKDTMRPAGQ